MRQNAVKGRSEARESGLRTAEVGSAQAMLGAVLTLALVACAVFVGVAIHELDYASGHPYAYGPAKVIALAAGAGALLAAGVGLLAGSLMRREARS